MSVSLLKNVLAELHAYAPLVTPGSDCVVFDTLIEDLPADMFFKSRLKPALQQPQDRRARIPQDPPGVRDRQRDRPQAPDQRRAGWVFAAGAVKHWSIYDE